MSKVISILSRRESILIRRRETHPPPHLSGCCAACDQVLDWLKMTDAAINSLLAGDNKEGASGYREG